MEVRAKGTLWIGLFDSRPENVKPVPVFFRQQCPDWRQNTFFGDPENPPCKVGLVSGPLVKSEGGGARSNRAHNDAFTKIGGHWGPPIPLPSSPVGPVVQRTR